MTSQILMLFCLCERLCVSSLNNSLFIKSQDPYSLCYLHQPKNHSTTKKQVQKRPLHTGTKIRITNDMIIYDKNLQSKHTKTFFQKVHAFNNEKLCQMLKRLTRTTNIDSSKILATFKFTLKLKLNVGMNKKSIQTKHNHPA